METPSDRLRRARMAKGYTSAREAARHYGWNEVTYITHENGSRGLRIATARVYAKAFGVPISELVGIATSEPIPIGKGVCVLGEAAIGIWRDAVLQTPSGQSISVPDPHPVERFAVRLADHSVDKLINKDEYAVCEPALLSDIEPGNLVVLRRFRQGLTEISVRRVSEINGNTIRATGYSSDNLYAAMVDITLGTEASLMGRVIAKYAEFPL